MERAPMDKAVEGFDRDPMRDRKEDDERVGRMVQGPGGEGDPFPDFSSDEGAAPSDADQPRGAKTRPPRRAR